MTVLDRELASRAARESRPEPRPAATSRDVLVTFRGVSVDFGTRRALHDVDAEIAREEIVTLIGPNGAGKSTFARLAMGALRPNAGTVSIAPSVKVAYVPQRLRIDATMPLTVWRLLDLPIRHSAQSKRRACGQLGIDDVERREVRDLSGGELQRVLLARALLTSPDLLVLDEPTRGVDYTGQAKFYRLIKDIRERVRCAVLLISHDLHLVMAATDRVICLNGHVCCSGRPEAITADPAYTALFGTAATPAVAVYRHEHDHEHVVGGAPSAI